MNYPIYCEQPLSSFYFEPINTLTNLFFMCAGILLFFILKKENKLDVKAVYFSALLFIIGVGSFLWHFHRTDFNLMADSIPIALFVLSYLYFYLVRTVDKIGIRLLLFFGFFAYTPLVIRLLNNNETIEFLGNGGMEYAIALSYFLVLQIYTFFYKPELLKKSLIIVGLFFTSILFRQIDLILCETIPFGSHFVWHILNSIVLYLFVRLLYDQKVYNHI